MTALGLLALGYKSKHWFPSWAGAHTLTLNCRLQVSLSGLERKLLAGFQHKIMNISPKKRRREEDNVLKDMSPSSRRKICFQSQDIAKSKHVQILSVKNTTLSKLTERSPGKFMTNVAIFPKTKVPNFSATENFGRLHPNLIWSILTQAKGAPQDERTLCITLLRVQKMQMQYTVIFHYFESRCCRQN